VLWVDAGGEDITPPHPKLSDPKHIVDIRSHKMRNTSKFVPVCVVVHLSNLHAQRLRDYYLWTLGTVPADLRED
jgi:hypothetical protein